MVVGKKKSFCTVLYIKECLYLKKRKSVSVDKQVKSFQLAPPAPSSGRRCIKQILVTFPLLLLFFCSRRQPLMRFATLCKWWLPPPPTSSLLRFSEDSWVWPEYVNVFSFLSFHPRESCSCWTRRPSLNTVEARCFFCGSSSSCHLLDLHKIDRTEEATLLVTPLTLVMLRASCCLEHKSCCGHRTRNDYSTRTDSIFVSTVVNTT